MSEALFYLFGLPVTAYALGMALSLAVAFIFASVRLNKSGFKPKVTEIFALLAIPLCLLLSRLVYVLVRLNYFLEREDGMAFRFWQGGYTVWGAILGFLLAGFLTSRLTGISAKNLLDILAPAGMLLVALGRFCEGLTGQGFGEETPLGLHFFPFSVVNEFGEWRWAVFMLEGLAALLFLLIVLRDKDFYPGGRIRHALIFLCAFQILFESFREDEFLRWGFVRAGQLLPAIFLFLLLLTALKKGGGGWRAPSYLLLMGFVLCTSLIIALEFALDKTTIPSLVLYGVMFLACLCLYYIVFIAAFKKTDVRVRIPQKG